MSTPPILEQLEFRGMIHQVTNRKSIDNLFDRQSVRVYIGFDPTASSLHVGNLLPILFLHHLQKVGHQPIVVIGGATGSIGDPSGRSTERSLLTKEVIDENSQAIKSQLEKFLDFSGSTPAIMVNNADWTEPVSLIEWLRDIGKHFTVNYMMGKESVKRRLDGNDEGLSFTEFSYMLLQSFDFLKLYEKFNCLVQAGGSDQWGNITAGIELIRRKCGAEAYGVTLPLITTSSGEKFGKSVGNAIWLDSKRTSEYNFYQFFMRTDDRDVKRFLKLFTFLPLDEIDVICLSHEEFPEKRKAQKILAEEVTKIVHGEQGVQKAIRATDALFGGVFIGLSNQELKDVFADAPSTCIVRERLSEENFSITELLLQVHLCSSKGEVRRLIENGGVYLNNQQVIDYAYHITFSDLATKDSLVLRIGKKNYHLVHFAEEFVGQ
jgi:tyrosyl-tRNA synthetase